MKVIRLTPASLLLVVLTVSVLGCSRDDSASILIDGSSTVYPITEAVAEEYIKVHPDVHVTVGVSGSGSGFARFARGVVDVADASRPIKPRETKAAAEKGIQYIELPVAFDGISVVVNPENDWVDCLTVEELRKLWEPSSQVDSWDDIRPSFPNKPIHLYGPSTSDGTYDYFTEAIVGESGASRSEYTASEDDNVLVQGIAGDPYSLGYFGYAYYENNRNKLKVLGIDDGDPTNGEGCIKPAPESIQSNRYQPLSRPLFIYVRADRADDPAMQSFVNFYLEHAGTLAPEVGYVALSDTAYDLIETRFRQRVTGSLYEEGAVTGVPLEETYRRAAADADSTGGTSAGRAVRP